MSEHWAWKWRAKGAVTVTCLTWPNEQLSLFLTWLFLGFAWLCVVELCFSSPGFFLSKLFSCEIFWIRWDLQGGVDITFQGLLLLLHWLTDIIISPGVKPLGWEPVFKKIFLQGRGVFCNFSPLWVHPLPLALLVHYFRFLLYKMEEKAVLALIVILCA